MPTLRNFAALLAMLVLSFTMSIATAASATTMSEVLISAENPGKLQSFSRDEYYIRAGGTPPTLEALAADPRKFFRHQMAYEVFKRGFEIQLGESLSDDALKRLLAGNKVRNTRDCVGLIYTPGVDRAGNVSWLIRACAPGEKLLELRVGNKWVAVASMGCLNLINAPVLGPVPAPLMMTGGGFTPPPGCKGTGCNPPPPPPPPPPCTSECEPPPPPPPPPGCKGKDCRPEKPVGQNPGNGKPVGNSPFDGITGNSGKNDANKGSPPAGPMDGQRDDQGPQPGGGQGPSDANGNQGGKNQVKGKKD